MNELVLEINQILTLTKTLKNSYNNALNAKESVSPSDINNILDLIIEKIEKTKCLL